MIFIINLLWVTWLSEKINDRLLLGAFSELWVLPLLIALECLPATRSHWATWVLSILLFAQPYLHAAIVASTSRNAGSVRTRAVASAIYNMAVQISNVRQEYLSVSILPFFRSFFLFSLSSPLLLHSLL